MTPDLTAVMVELNALNVHPVGVTVEGSLIALQLSPAEQAAVLADAARREQIVAALTAHGFLYVTLTLESSLEVPA